MHKHTNGILCVGKKILKSFSGYLGMRISRITQKFKKLTYMVLLSRSTIHELKLNTAKINLKHYSYSLGNNKAYLIHNLSNTFHISISLLPIFLICNFQGTFIYNPPHKIYIQFSPSSRSNFHSISHSGYLFLSFSLSHYIDSVNLPSTTSLSFWSFLCFYSDSGCIIKEEEQDWIFWVEKRMVWAGNERSFLWRAGVVKKFANPPILLIFFFICAYSLLSHTMRWNVFWIQGKLNLNSSSKPLISWWFYINKLSVTRSYTLFTAPIAVNWCPKA